MSAVSAAKTWKETGLFFDNLPRRRKTTKIMLHHTKSENEASAVFSNLQSERKSVQFFIDAAGQIYQFCDADSFAEHGGKLDADGVTSTNKDTVGIEIQNLASKVPNTLNRPLYSETIHGKTNTRTGFLPVQTASVIELCKALCNNYSLPVAVPTDAEGEVIARILTVPEWEAFSGIVGHFHATERRGDPGIRILEDIMNSV